MKNGLKKIIVLTIMVILMGVMPFLGTQIVMADTGVSEEQSSLSSFLEFERAVIELSKNDEPSSTEGDSGVLQFKVRGDVTSKDQEKKSFKNKRILVDGIIDNDYGATNHLQYKDVHLLCYETEEQTEYAYNQLILDDRLDVVNSEPCSVEEYAEQEYTYNPNDINAWGRRSIDVGGYRQFLDDRGVNKEVVVVVIDTGISTINSVFNNRLLKDTSGKIRGFSYCESTLEFSKNKNDLAFDKDDPTTAINEADTNRYSFEDDHGHGSHVAGIVCSLTPENVKILPIKIGDENGWSNSEKIKCAYLRVIEIYSKQFDIVSTNLSFSGGGKKDTDERDFFNKNCYEPLLELNILPITAAGNECAENDIEGLKAVVVSSLADYGNHYAFDRTYSNYGKIIDICAPGTKILSASKSNSNGTNKDSVELSSGTSMASPQVAGVVALLYLNPNLQDDFTALDIERMLYDYALDMGEPGYDIRYGHGMLSLKYFEHKESENVSLSFYKNGSKVNEYKEFENFTTGFSVSIECTDSSYDIIYTTDGKIPGLGNANEYTSAIQISRTTCIYAMGVKCVNNEIVARTDLYCVSYFHTLEENINDYLGYYIEEGVKYLMYVGYFEEIDLSGVNLDEYVGNNLFLFSNLKSITLSSSTKSISEGFFAYCNSLEDVYAPCVTSVGNMAFKGSGITKVSSSSNEGVYLPQLTTIAGQVFSKCAKLKSVDLPNVTTMGEGGFQFYCCISLTSVNLPLVTTIPQRAFMGCIKLSGIFDIGKSVNSIGMGAFTLCPITKFEVHANNRYLYTDGYGLYEIGYLNTDGYGLYEIGYLKAFAMGSINQNSTYTILSTVKIDGSYWQVRSIGAESMCFASLQELTIPESIMYINKSAFAGSTIKKLNFNATNCYDSYYQSGGYKSNNIFGKIETIEIGENVEEVPQLLFYCEDFDNVIINSKGTNLLGGCLYREASAGDLNSLVFNFTEGFDYDYLYMLISQSGIVTENDIRTIYSKSEFPVDEIGNYFNNLPYRYTEGDYYVYSEIPNAQTYTITASSGVGGTISNEGTKTVQEGGSSATYIFTPNVGYKVKAIYIDNEALNGYKLQNAIEHGYQFTNVTTNHTIRVEFEKLTYTIEVTQANGGKITPDTSSFEYGDDATFTITPDDGYYVKYLIIDGRQIDGKNGYTFLNVTESHEISAVFEELIWLQEYDITIVSEGYGQVSPIGTQAVKYSNSLKIYITPNTGYHIESILVNSQEISDNEINNVKSSGCFQIHSVMTDYTIKIVFAPNTDTKYTVKVWKEVLDSSYDKVFGELYYDLEDSYILEGVTNQQTNVQLDQIDGFDLQIQQTNISPNGQSIVNAIYTRIRYRLTVEKDDGITDVSGGGIYPYGKTINLIADVDYRYEWCGWMIGDDIVSQDISFAYQIPSRDVTIKATSEIIKFTITVEQALNGSIAPTTAEYDYGSSPKFVITPNSGYYVKHLIIDGQILRQSLTEYTFKNITQDHSISAVFEDEIYLKEYSVNISYSGNGYVSPVTAQKINHGNELTININPNQGYHVEYIKINDIDISQDDLDKVNIDRNFKLENVTSNLSIDIRFEPNTDTQYKVIIWKEVLTSFNAKLFNGKYYICEKTLTEYGTTNEMTNVELEVVDGYKAQEVVQQKISANGTTEVNILYIRNSYVLSIEKDDGINIVIGAGKHPFGKMVSLRADVQSNYNWLGWTIDGELISMDKTYSYEMPMHDVTLKASAKLKTFNITFDIGDHGTVNYDQDTVVDYGSSLIYKVVPEEGYGIDYIKINNKIYEATNNTIELDFVSEDVHIEIGFGIVFQIVTSSDANGKVTQSSDVVCGHNKRIYFEPNPGYEVDEVIIDGVSKGAITSYEFKDITQSHTITVTYKVKTYRIVCLANDGGMYNCDSSLSSIEYGSSRVINLVPNEGWEVKSVTMNGVDIEIENNQVVLVNITSDITLNIEFGEIQKELYFGISLETLGIIALSVFGALVLIGIISGIKRKMRRY